LDGHYCNNKMTTMKNKTAIVTGASGNMGQAVIKKFLAEGYNVVGTIIPNDPVPFEVDDAKLEKVIVDLMNEDDSAKFVQDVIARYGSVDSAVLTVGGFAMADIAGTTTAMIGQQYRLNFETAYNVARPVFVQMRKQGAGTIFLIGSKAGMEAGTSKGMIAYGLSKSLLFRLAELMNEEAAGTAVKTIVIVPSTIDTPQNSVAMPGADFSTWQTPGFIANTIFTLSSSVISNESVVVL